MPSALKSFTLAAALAGSAMAHFQLQIPTSLGFVDDKEAEGPCGGFDITSRKPEVDDFHVDGSAISVKTGHPQTRWVIKGALLNDTKNLVDISPNILETGQGEFCVTVKAPKEWAGQDGVIQVQQNGHDGQLYQCAAVKFVEGVQASAPSACKNSTGIKSEFVTASTSTDEHGGHANASGTETGAAPAKTSSGAAQFLAGIGTVAGAAVIALLLA